MKKYYDFISLIEKEYLEYVYQADFYDFKKDVDEISSIVSILKTKENISGDYFLQIVEFFSDRFLLTYNECAEMLSDINWLDNNIEKYLKKYSNSIVIDVEEKSINLKDIDVLKCLIK